MKIFLSILFVLACFTSMAQLNKAESILNKNVSLNLTVYDFYSVNIPYNRQSSFYYVPQKSLGLSVINVRRPGTYMDDVYFIDQNGQTDHRTMMQTKPVNMMMQQNGRSDSFNPMGSHSFGEAVANGVASLLLNGNYNP